MLRNAGCGLNSLRCTWKWVPEHSKQQRQCILTSINLFTLSHCGAPQLTTGENEMGFSVDFLVSAIDGKEIEGVLSFPLHHWQNKFKTWGELESSPKTSPWACKEQNRSQQNRWGKGQTTYLPGQTQASFSLCDVADCQVKWDRKLWLTSEV